MRKLKAALLSFAHVHASSYARVLKELENVDFVAIWDDNEARGKKAEEQYKVRYYRSLEDLFKLNRDLDFVVIASENAKHYELVKYSLENDVHVLVEKPFTTRLDHADELIRLSRNKGRYVGVCFVMRYHSAVLQAKGMVDKGEIGELVSITTTNHGTCPYKAAHWFVEPELSYGARIPLKPGDGRFRGGSVTDHTVHCADLLRWITGSEAYEVFAEVGENIRGDLEVEDNALILIKFRNGVQASIDCSWSRPEGVYPTWGDVNLYILGTGGVIELESFNQQISLASWTRGKLEYIYWGPDVDFIMIRDFAEAITNDREPRATAFDGRQASEIMLAAYESISTGKPIRLPLT